MIVKCEILSGTKQSICIIFLTKEYHFHLPFGLVIFFVYLARNKTGGPKSLIIEVGLRLFLSFTYKLQI